MLLALDTATPLVSVAVHDGERVLAQGGSQTPMKHGEELAPTIAAVLAEADVDRRELDAIAVGVGPGPFTGLRVGLVTARTLAHVLAIPVRGVCSLDVLAVQAHAEAVTEGRPLDVFHVATDARRKEVYLAEYDPDARRVAGPVVGKAAELAATLRGPVVGEGADLYPDALGPRRGPARPSAAWLAEGVQRGIVEMVEPEPWYLRRPDAVESAARKPVS